LWDILRVLNSVINSWTGSGVVVLSFRSDAEDWALVSARSQRKT
jgi:hypothetical protein